MAISKFVIFSDFIASLTTISAKDLINTKFAKVVSEDHVEDMRGHLLNYYKDVTPNHSFVDKFKHTWDCIPITQQPSLRNTGLELAKPPEIKFEIGQTRLSNTSLVQPPFVKKSRLGDPGQVCPDGCIPLRRITLHELSEFETIADYFRKTPRAGGRHKKLGLPEAEPPYLHKYANAYQRVANIGGHSFMSIQKPKISGNEVFSLCQHWYTSANQAPLQTVEAGWQVFPQHYGTNYPVLFIYWTADNYGQTGAYNLEKPGFVQTSSVWKLGGALTNYSTPGRKTYEMELSWFFHEGNWWLYINGLDSQNVVGYYPGSIYNGGPLSKGAQDVDYGGEVVGNISWPQMGSGLFANAGTGQAAYQRGISYFSAAGQSKWANLAPQQNTPACYTIDVHSDNKDGESFFYGGPGGSGC